MRLWLCSLLMLESLMAQPKGRVFLISLDGLGYQAYSEDPAASELKSMKKLAAEGIYAPMQAAFPSQTAPGHASIFTGVYGNINGVTANNVPTGFDQYASGFRAEQLKTETVWVKAARAGVRAVAHNPTQGFPCTTNNVAPNVTLMNGYQTAEVAPQTLLRASNVRWLDAPPEDFAMRPKSRQPARYFSYDSGRIQFVGVVFAKGLRYDSIRMTARSGKRYVDVSLKDAEQEPIRLNGGGTRPLARYFSEALPVANLTAIHFRLFELSADGSQFLLYQSEGKEISVCKDGPTQDARFKQRLIHSAGGFIGNGAGAFYSRGEFGTPNTDGMAERRWLESLELHARQTMRHTRSLLSEYDPRLLVDYLSTPDDMLHAWWGLATQGDRANEAYRRWGYQIIDWRIDQLRQLLKEGDHLLIVSDHGMTSIEHEVRLNRWLKDNGYADRVTTGAYFLRLKDRADKTLLTEVQGKLSALEDNGQKLIPSWYLPAEAAAKFGIGGPSGGDLYFDLSPGYGLAYDAKQPLIVKLPHRVGIHGPLPTRSDLLALFIAYGPELQSRPATMRSVDVAPFVLRLLGL